MQNIAGNVVGQTIGQMMNDIVAPTFLTALVFAILVYFIPTIIAFLRHRKDKSAIFLINVLLGWTIIGWIAAFLRAFGKRRGDGVKRRRSSKKRK